MSSIGLAALFMSALVGLGQAEQQEPTTVEGVTIEALRERQQERLERTIDTFIEETAVTVERNGQLGRYDRRICPGVMNLAAGPAQTINDRIALAVQAVGLSVGRPGCDPNLLIIVTEDSDRLAIEMMDRYGRIFAQHVNDQERGLEFLEAFARPGQTIRWWHMTEKDTGNPPPSAHAAMGWRCFGCLSSGLRLSAAYETDIFRTFVIVDSTRIGEIDPSSLGDYLAMTTLARISPDAQTRGVNTILNLFDDNAPAEARASYLSNWDIGYLQSLYGSRGNVRTTRMQINDIAYRMGRRVNYSDLAPDDEEDSTTPEE